ncbi:WbqC family protein [Paucibacter sp. XJ19-41]|uniref:WbqC family protein n=1 Tax=Paucibacter sp. XJ19-41 TaxID=2927824 RepID=UPI00234BF016|nr:WbqC family protein [Paucibacter sp. XJ19-41]MDC6166120.1 WbqC family protein [Paucibacter sp. XJ19-41]
MRLVVLQSNYIPWKGYFDLIHDADVFIFYDDVQYTKNDWRNRNRIKTARGSQWLTIPTGIDAKRLVCEVELIDPGWQRSHWDSLRHSYGQSPFFGHYRPFFEEIYLAHAWRYLSELNQHMIRRIATELLGLRTRFEDSRSYSLSGEKQERLLDLVRQSGASHYLSGPAARAYIEPARFAELGVELQWKDYAGYPEYGQAHPPFEHGVSIVDLLFHVGPAAPTYIWGWRDATALRS